MIVDIDVATLRPMADPLEGFEKTTFTHGGKTRDVYKKGTGPAVIVIAEMPGITPKVIEFARQVEALGCTVALPHLFGTPGRDPLESGAGLCTWRRPPRVAR